MKKYRGEAHNIRTAVIGSITKQKKSIFHRKKYIYACSEINEKSIGYGGIICNYCENKYLGKSDTVIIPNLNIDELNEGDVVLLNNNGEMSILWDVKSNQNSLMITEECNCRCLMCPQPPRKDTTERHKINKKILGMLEPEKVSYVCLTGGEPLLFQERLIEIFSILNTRFPNTEVTLLTNGKNFSNFELCKNLSNVMTKKTVICISLHADTDLLHDKITRSNGSFNEITKGIHNLAKFRKKIEIRYVINSMNFARLKSFSEFVYRNFPFAVHVAFMGLEISGYAKNNFSKIWVDPQDFRNEVEEAVLSLHRRGMNVSVYNIPLCLTSKKIWEFTRQSISSWKNDYLEVCDTCDVKKSCCGIFTTSEYHSENIQPVLNF